MHQLLHKLENNIDIILQWKACVQTNYKLHYGSSSVGQVCLIQTRLDASSYTHLYTPFLNKIHLSIGPSKKAFSSSN